MNRKFTTIYIAALASLAIFFSPVTAQAEPPVWTKGVIKKIDMEQGKVTVKHGEIKNLDMPGMTMIFRVTDPKLLETMKAGQKGEFYFIDQNGRMMIKQVK